MSHTPRVLKQLERAAYSRERLADQYLQRAERYRSEAMRMREVRAELARRLKVYSSKDGEA